MAIQDEMYKSIEQEIDSLINANKLNLVGKEQKAKDVAKMLTELSVGPQDANNLVSQYIVQIRNICRQVYANQ